jgi:hypothetical protein
MDNGFNNEKWCLSTAGDGLENWSGERGLKDLRYI